MVVFPPCKINLGLSVVARRTDGYHDLETCFYPVPWTDILEILPSKNPSFVYSGLPIPGNDSSNLCKRAYELLKQEFSLPAIQLHLHKVIPMGAGLGGGSSDAAYVLRVLDQLFELHLTPERLTFLATQLGSDCPYFMNSAPLLGQARGEQLSPVKLSLSGKFLLIVYPNLSIDTGEAFWSLTPKHPVRSVKSVVEGHLKDWKKELINDFETPVFSKYPVLREIKDTLYEQGAFYAGMSGSGSSVFGLFDREPEHTFFHGKLMWRGLLSV